LRRGGKVLAKGKNARMRRGGKVLAKERRVYEERWKGSCKKC